MSRSGSYLFPRSYAVTKVQEFFYWLQDKSYVPVSSRPRVFPAPQRHRPAAQAKGKTTARARAALLSDRRLARRRAPQLKTQSRNAAEANIFCYPALLRFHANDIM